MFFILSKILAFVASPATWIVGLFIAYLIVKHPKKKKRLLIAGISATIFFTNPFMATTLLKAWEKEPIPITTLEKHDIGIVFTGMTLKGYTPADRVYFDKSSDRILMAVHLYKAHKIDQILITGGKGQILGDDEGETPVLHRFLLMLGIPDSAIILEPTADNTYQNALYAKALVDGKNKKCILITSAFHMRRSMACCKKVGLEVTSFPVDYRTRAAFHSIGDVVIPSSISLYQWRTLLHEWIGYFSYWMTGKI